MRPLDWTVLLVLMALIVGDGLRHGRKTRNVKDYFLAGHGMRGAAADATVADIGVPLTRHGRRRSG